MQIGEIAQAASVTTKTLRYYERLGLLPEPERTAAGYRIYEAATLQRLAFIRAAQALGLTLGEIREILQLRDLGETPCAHVVDLIRRRTTELDQRIGELEQLRSELRRLDRRASRLDPAACDPERICHVIGAH
jgi:MerR family transcriptional regulator, copper efflux regulator